MNCAAAGNVDIGLKSKAVIDGVYDFLRIKDSHP